MTKAQFLSTEGVPHARRREWLCEVIGREYARADACALPTQPLFNEMTIYGEIDVRLSAIRSNAILIERPKRPSLPDSQDVYLAVVLLSGEYFLEQGERRAALRPGDMTIYDATRPHKIYCPGSFSKLIVSLPRAAMRMRLPDMDRRLATPIAGARGLGAIAAAHIRSIAAHAAVLTDEVLRGGDGPLRRPHRPFRCRFATNSRDRPQSRRHAATGEALHRRPLGRSPA